MAYVTLPPVVEIREAFRRTEKGSVSVLAAWTRTPSEPLGSWKNYVFAKLAHLERGPNVPGFGNFKLSEEAAGQLRLRLAGISLQSLPIPSVAPLSGRGAQLDWQSGTRSVELTAFADGELVIEAIDNGTPVEMEEEEELESYLKWLVGAGDRQLEYAAAR
jgi:hypothetical protein